MASESTYTPLRMAKELYMLQNNGKRKRGRKPVFSANKFYPWKVELEIKEFIASMLRDNGKKLKELALLGYQADGLDDVNAADVFTPSNIEEKAGDFFREVSDFSSRKMDDFAEKTVGRTIGYIPNQSKLRDDFVNNFVANCKSAAEDQKKEIASAVYKHRMFPNEDSGSLVKEINSINTKYTKNKSKFIARNETGNLNGAIQRTQMEGAGFRYYKWMCMLDGVTRDTHRSMNGLVCDWDDDTIYSDDGGKTWKKRTGSMFIGQPGQDYNCRCTAIPFDPELEDDYEVKEMPEEKPEEKEPTPLEKAREEAKAAEERAEKAAIDVKEYKEKIETFENDIEKVSFENGLLKEEIKGYSFAKIINNILSRRKFKDMFDKETIHKYGDSGLLVSKTRLEQSKKSSQEKKKFDKEVITGEILSKNNHSVILIPETIDTTSGLKHPDAILDGVVTEFKCISGGKNKLWVHYKDAFSKSEKIIFRLVKKEQDMSYVINGLKGEFEQHYAKHKSSMIPKDKNMLIITSDGKIHKIDLEKFWEKILSPRD